MKFGADLNTKTHKMFTRWHHQRLWGVSGQTSRKCKSNYKTLYVGSRWCYAFDWILPCRSDQEIWSHMYSLGWIWQITEDWQLPVSWQNAQKTSHFTTPMQPIYNINLCYLWPLPTFEVFRICRISKMRKCVKIWNHLMSLWQPLFTKTLKAS